MEIEKEKDSYVIEKEKEKEVLYVLNSIDEYNSIEINHTICFLKGPDSWVFGKIYSRHLFKTYIGEIYSFSFYSTFSVSIKFKDTKDEYVNCNFDRDLYIITSKSYDILLNLEKNPFKSEAQRRWMWTNHPRMAREWAKHSEKH